MLGHAWTPFRKLTFLKFAFVCAILINFAHICARFLRMFPRILQFPSWQGTCHNQKKYEKTKNTHFATTSLLAPRNPNTNNHKDTTQVIQGAPQEKGRG
jgi:hypothetical protein